MTNAAQAGSLALGGDLEVNRLGFGAMRITGDGIWGPPRDRERAVAVVRRAVELGVDFIDTADSYGPHVSEELLAEALHPYPAGLVIATKGGLTRSGPGAWEADITPAHLREACEGSLRRLRVERIDLYQLHTSRGGEGGRYEEALGTLKELRDEGKIRHVGVSNVDVDQLELARGIVEVVSVQNRYSFGDRASEPVLRECERHGIAFIPWFPLGAGNAHRDEALNAVAQRHQASPFQIAIAWLLQRSPMMLPIPGTGSPDHLEENLAAAALQLTDEDVAALE